LPAKRDRKVALLAKKKSCRREKCVGKFDAPRNLVRKKNGGGVVASLVVSGNLVRKSCRRRKKNEEVVGSKFATPEILSVQRGWRVWLSGNLADKMVGLWQVWLPQERLPIKTEKEEEEELASLVAPRNLVDRHEGMG